MGWISRAPLRHPCFLPFVMIGLTATSGDRWECDECGKQWKWTGTEWSRVFLKRRLKEPKA